MQLNAWLQLGEVQEVPAVDGEFIEVLLGQNTGDADLVRVDLHLTRIDLDRLRLLTQDELGVAVGHGAGPNDGGEHQLVEAGGGDLDDIVARVQGTHAVVAQRVHAQLALVARVGAGDDDAGSRNGGAGGVGDGALNRTTIDRDGLPMPGDCDQYQYCNKAKEVLHAISWEILSVQHLLRVYNCCKSNQIHG